MMNTSKVQLKNKSNSRIVHALKHTNKFGHISYFLIPRFCTYCGHEGLLDADPSIKDWVPNRCPACGLEQYDEVRPHIDRDEWGEVAYNTILKSKFRECLDEAFETAREMGTENTLALSGIKHGAYNTYSIGNVLRSIGYNAGVYENLEWGSEE